MLSGMRYRILIIICALLTLAAPAAAQEATATPTPFQLADNRFDWEVRSRDNITIHAYGWASEQMEEMLNQALAAQARIMQQLQAAKPAAIDIYVYDSVYALRAALSLHGRDAIEGYADPQQNVIAVSLSRAYPLLDMRRQIPHELTHIAIGHIVGEASVPAWLVEGLALVFEAEPDPDLRALFEAYTQGGALYPLEALCPAFPLDRAAFALAYAQSYEVIRYIENRYGPAGIRSLLDAYAQGATCEGGVAQGLGISFRALEQEWLRAIGQASAEEVPSPPPPVLLWVVLLLAFAAWPAIFLTADQGRSGQ